MSLRDEDSVAARQDREENRNPNPEGADFAELLKSTLDEIEHLRGKGIDERRARDIAIEGHCEGYELSAVAEHRLGRAVCDARGVAP